jgi:1-acyl-sn-glycerol-3-phosphate acyltransferase
MTSSDSPLTTALALYLRSSLFFVAMATSGILIGSLTVLAYPLGFATRYRVASQWVRFVLWSLQRICGLGFEVQGQENIPATNCIVLSKHQSTWETIGLQTVFRPVCFILKKELLRLPFWGWRWPRWNRSG